MIKFEKFILSNGLKVIVHEDASTPMVAVNVLYDVGAKDEESEKTGFAHLFEHLMFGGSINVEDFDAPLQRAGGESNAFTSNDITNYYDTLPAANIETALWLESDRMMSLAFSEQSLAVQKKVVCEEYRENYINKPYGDVWHKLRNLAYTTHAYRWPTIGKNLSHIEDATLDYVKHFFKKHYNPSNAILVIAGGVKTSSVKVLVEKWFASIPSGERYIRSLVREPQQQVARFLEVSADVPTTCLFKAYHMAERNSNRFYYADTLSDVLSNGSSARLYQNLVKGKNLFTDLDAYVLGSDDAGLFVVEGKLGENVKMQDAEDAIAEELNIVKNELVKEQELQKVKNKTESSFVFSNSKLLYKAMNLAIYERMGDANIVNNEVDQYLKITAEDLRKEANLLFDENNCSTMHYLSKN